MGEGGGKWWFDRLLRMFNILESTKQSKKYNDILLKAASGFARVS